MLFDLNYKLDPEEKLIALVRKHWFLAIPQLVEFLIIITLLIVFANKFFIFRYSFELTLILIAAYVIYLAYVWVLWRIDYFIITNKRVIRINHRGVWNRNLNEVHYSKIEDVTLCEKGITSAVFKFGSIKISLNNGGKFTLSDISGATKVYQAIIKLREIKNI